MAGLPASDGDVDEIARAIAGISLTAAHVSDSVIDSASTPHEQSSSPPPGKDRKTPVRKRSRKKGDPAATDSGTAGGGTGSATESDGHVAEGTSVSTGKTFGLSFRRTFKSFKGAFTKDKTRKPVMAAGPQQPGDATLTSVFASLSIGTQALGGGSAEAREALRPTTSSSSSLSAAASSSSPKTVRRYDPGVQPAPLVLADAMPAFHQERPGLWVANDAGVGEWPGTPLSPVHLFAQDLPLIAPRERQGLRLFAAQAVAAVLQHPVSVPADGLVGDLHDGGASATCSLSPSAPTSPAPLRRRSSLLLRLVHWRPGASGGESPLSSASAEPVFAAAAVPNSSPPRRTLGSESLVPPNAFASRRGSHALLDLGQPAEAAAPSILFGVPLARLLAQDNARLPRPPPPAVVSPVMSPTRTPSSASLSSSPSSNTSLSLSPTSTQSAHTFEHLSLPTTTSTTSSNTVTVPSVALHVPLAVQKCLDYLHAYGPTSPGIFRVSGAARRVRQLNEALEEAMTNMPVNAPERVARGSSDGTASTSPKHVAEALQVTGDVPASAAAAAANFAVDLTSYSPNDVASVLKNFLRSLPEPLLTHALYDAFLEVPKLAPEEQVPALANLCILLPTANSNLLQALLELLAAISAVADTPDGSRMNAHNLALILAPNLLMLPSAPAVPPPSMPPSRRGSLSTITLPPGLVHSAGSSSTNSMSDALPEEVAAENAACKVIEKLIEQHALIFHVAAATRDRALLNIQSTDPVLFNATLEELVALAPNRRRSSHRLLTPTVIAPHLLPFQMMQNQTPSSHVVRPAITSRPGHSPLSRHPGQPPMTGAHSSINISSGTGAVALSSLGGRVLSASSRAHGNSDQPANTRLNSDGHNSRTLFVLAPATFGAGGGSNTSSGIGSGSGAAPPGSAAESNATVSVSLAGADNHGGRAECGASPPLVLAGVGDRIRGRRRSISDPGVAVFSRESSNSSAGAVGDDDNDNDNDEDAFVADSCKTARGAGRNCTIALTTNAGTGGGDSSKHIFSFSRGSSVKSVFGSRNSSKIDFAWPVSAQPSIIVTAESSMDIDNLVEGLEPISITVDASDTFHGHVHVSNATALDTLASQLQSLQLRGQEPGNVDSGDDSPSEALSPTMAFLRASKAARTEEEFLAKHGFFV